MAKARTPAQVYQLKITLRDIKPPVWRRVLLKDCALPKLHNIIQVCFGWGGFHLHAFDIGGEQFSEPDPDGMMDCEDEIKIKLSQVVDQGFKKFSYTYDFGDNWDHLIEIEKTLPAEAGLKYPLCVAGKRACPPEDCGGLSGYGNFLQAVANPKHPEHENMVEWIGEDFDPEAFDLDEINSRL
jgi:Plasmid pRiA4b ORF-3-like protein